MTYLVGADAQAYFFKATDEELSQKEAYQFMTPVFGKGVVFDSEGGLLYEQMKFIKSTLMANQLKRVRSCSCLHLLTA
jgi:sterol 14-demethylase